MIKFTDDLLTNVREIDEQHKDLFRHINTVIGLGVKAVSKEETDKTFDLLGEYVIKHFNDEEALQRRHGYPNYEAHCALHRHFIGEYKKLKAEYLQNGPSAAFTIRLNNSIVEWIVKHIRHEDVALGKFIAGKRG